MQVAPIITAVQERGDAAVREFTSKFDKVDLEAVCVPIDDIPMPSLPAHIEASFDIAYENIYNFHKAQEADEISVDTMPGVTCRQVRPLLTYSLQANVLKLLFVYLICVVCSSCTVSPWMPSLQVTHIDQAVHARTSIFLGREGSAVHKIPLNMHCAHVFRVPFSVAEI